MKDESLFTAAELGVKKKLDDPARWGESGNHHQAPVPRPRYLRGHLLPVAEEVPGDDHLQGQEVRKLEKENKRLKRLLAERDVEIDGLKELVRKNP